MDDEDYGRLKEWAESRKLIRKIDQEKVVFERDVA